MKLNPASAEQVANQLGAVCVAEANPAIPALSQSFAEHTFFLDAEGLFILEAESDGGGEMGRVVKLARWSDPDRTVLSPHAPEKTGLVITLSDGDVRP